jgi:choice-of-anchor A domain-containing protein
MKSLASRLIAALFCLVWAAVPAGATVLGTAGYYNEFIFGDIIQEKTDSQGRVAAGGNVIYSNMSVASEIEVKDPRYPELVVGGNLYWANGSVGYFSDTNSGSSEFKKGDIVVGGTATIPQNNGGSSVTYGSLTTGAALPFDFAAEQSYLQGMSTFWGNLSPTAVPTYQLGDDGRYLITLTGFNSDLNIFNLGGDFLSDASKFSIEVPYGSTLLVNVSGKYVAMEDFGFFYDGIQGDNNPKFPDPYILYNFFEATALSIAGIEVHGSVLAPWANILFNNGHIEGNLIARSLFGTGEAHNELFNGNLPSHPVPEPATVILLGGGLIGVFAARRRLRD